MTLRPRAAFAFVGVWFALCLAVSFAHAGLNRDTVTRLLILVYLLASALAYLRYGRPVETARPGLLFGALSLLGAMWSEASYMISKPLHPSLLVSPGTPPLEALRRTAIDLALTAPAYAAIFAVIWAFARRYRYSSFSFFFVMGLGQALGDGWTFFFGRPLMLLLVPYVMSNYWAMTFVPFLLVGDRIPDQGRKQAGAWAHLLPLLALPAVYFAVAAVILTAGAKLGLLR